VANCSSSAGVKSKRARCATFRMRDESKSDMGIWGNKRGMLADRAYRKLL
jgi:hypothetical protein